MKNNFIVDQEINLNENDFLKTKTYADNLTKIIKKSTLNKVFTVGLFGNWGTGKSSIVKTSQQDFDETKVKFITYDAWQYVNDSFRRMFLRSLREELKYEETDLMKKFYENESTDIGNKYQLSSTRLSFILGGLVLLLAIFAFLPFKIEYKLPVYSVFTLLGLLITIISGAFHQLKISVTKPHLFAPEQFEECFKEIITNSLSKRSNTNKILKWIQGDKSIRNLDKLIIVIDNIDRCGNDVAYNLLTDIKTFLSSSSLSIVFVIPVDDEALKNHIINTTKNSDCNREKEEFLRKFFNVTIRIKPYGTTDMYSFAKKICEKNELNFKPETISVASKEYAKNPRRIIQLFNNLLAETNYYDADFIEKNETLICCLLIIREEYPEYYIELVNSPKLLNNEYNGKNEDVKRFIRIAHIVLGKARVSDISMVLTNTHHHFDNIALDIKDAIDTFDADKVVGVWESESSLIVNYVCDKLDNAIKNELIESELVAYFDLITQVNKTNPFEAHIAKRIDEKVLDYLPIVISKTKNHHNLCTYAFLRNEQKDDRIKQALIEESKRSKDQEKGDYWDSLFNSVLEIFKDSRTSQSMASTYTLYNESVKYDDFSKDQIENLLSKEFVQNKIDDLNPNKEEEISLNIDTDEYKSVKWLFENKKNISAESYANLFAKIIGVDNSESRMRGKSIDDIANILTFLNPLLKLIPNGKLEIQPQTLYALIVNNRKIPHPSYPQHTQHDSEKNFIDECISEEKYISEIKDFVFEIYRISNNTTRTNNEIKKLLDYIYLDAEFAKLINKGCSLNSVLDIILDGHDRFDNEDRLTVLNHCFNQKNFLKTYSVSETKAKEKLQEMLNYAQNKQSSNVFDLIESLSNQERYKKIISDLIIEKNSNFINSLPNNLLTLAVNSFNNSNFNEYANNFEFLSVIVINGNDTQKSNIVKILITKLDENRDISLTLNLIAEMDNISAFDEAGLLYAHLTEYYRKNKEALADEDKTLIKELKKKVKPAT